MEQYGTYVRLGDGGTARICKVFLQSVRSTGQHNIESLVSPLGETSRGLYFYIGPVDAGVEEGDLLMLGQKRYRFRKVEKCYFGSYPIYQWGLLVEKGENDTWGS